VWTPPEQTTAEGFADALAALGARPWQTRIVAPMLAAAFEAHPRT